MTGPVYSVMEKQDYRSRWLPAVPALEPSLKDGLIRPQVRHDTKTLLMARQQTGLGRQPRTPLRPGTLFR